MESNQKIMFKNSCIEEQHNQSHVFSMLSNQFDQRDDPNSSSIIIHDFKPGDQSKSFCSTFRNEIEDNNFEEGKKRRAREIDEQIDEENSPCTPDNASPKSVRIEFIEFSEEEKCQL